MDKDTHVVTPSKLKDALSSFLANITSKFGLDNLNKIASPKIYTSAKSITVATDNFTTIFSDTLPAGTYVIISWLIAHTSTDGIMISSLSFSETHNTRCAQTNGGGVINFITMTVSRNTKLTMSAKFATEGLCSAQMAVIQLN